LLIRSPNDIHEVIDDQVPEDEEDAHPAIDRYCGGMFYPIAIRRCPCPTKHTDSQPANGA
jgi:hypothetical protein